MNKILVQKSGVKKLKAERQISHRAVSSFRKMKKIPTKEFANLIKIELP